MNTHVKFEMEKNQAVRQVLEVWYYPRVIETCFCRNRDFCTGKIGRRTQYINL